MGQSQQLTIKQDRIIDAVLDPKVSTRKDAAIVAGYSAKTADSQASQVLSNPKVAQALEKRREQRSDKAKGDLAKFERMASKFGKAVDAIDPERLDAQTLIGSLQVFQKLKESELQIRERYGIDRASDPQVLASQARSLQALIVTAIRCAIERPAVAARILARAGVEIEQETKGSRGG